MKSQRKNATKGSKREALRALRAADAAWLKAFQTRDLKKAAAFVDAQGSMMPPNAPVATGRTAAAKLIAAGFELRDYRLAWHPNKAGAARSGEMGYTSGRYKVRFRDASGKMIFDNGKYLLVWRRQATGEWKVLFDMNNSDLPAGQGG
jgi:ketosteroid isomerase-like protein